MDDVGDRIKIKFFYKLLAVFGLLCIIIGVILVFGDRTVKDTSDTLDVIVKNQVRSLAQVNQLHYRANQIRLSEIELLEITDYYTIAGGIDSLRELASEFEKELKDLISHFLKEEDKKKDLLLNSWKLYRKDLEQVLEHIKSARMTEAKETSRFSSFPRFQIFSKYLDTISSETEEKIRKAYSESIVGIENKRRMFLLISFIGVIVGIIITFLLSRSLSRRVMLLRREALRLAEGKLEDPIPVKGNDELADLAVSFNVMRVNIQDRENALRSAHDELEDRVKERTAELSKSNQQLEKIKGELEEGNENLNKEISERKKAEEKQNKLIEDLEGINKIMTGRELKMIELKKEINNLNEELNRKPPYDVSF